jgi:hypothetical protein
LILSKYLFVSSFVSQLHPRRSSKLWECNQANNPFVVVMDTDSAFDSIEHRSNLGIETALVAWPHLKYINEDLLKDQTWLRNRLLALAHVLNDTREFAIAARMLLEEQALDEGESNNKRGKYASKYHPQGMNDSNSTAATSKSSSSSSTRPLTVGEISANWDTSLRETLLIKYHCNYKEPMRILQKIIDERLDEVQDMTLPTLYREVAHIASSPRFKHSRMIVTATPSDQKMIEASLKHDNINYVVASSTSQAFEALASSPYYYRDRCSDEKEDPTIIILKQEKKSSEIILDLLQQAKEGTLIVIDSSWNRLESNVNLFGDSIPRNENIGNSVVQDTQLSLNLAEWTKPDPTQAAQATMSPWTDIIGWEKLQELLLPPQMENAFQ